MKDKGNSSQKKNTGSRGAPSTKRIASEDDACRNREVSPAGRSVQQTATAQIEARFRAVFENSRDAIGVSKAGVHVFVNPAYLELFGFPPGADIAGKPVLDLIAPESRDQIREYIFRRVRGESVPPTYQTRGLRTDGSAFDMEVNVSLYQENGEDHTLVILRDITERKRAEEEIAERGAMLQQIMDTASVAIGLVDKTGRITHANRRMAEMFGRTLEELAGCEYVELVHPSEREIGRKKMLALLASEIPSVDLERLYWRKDGTEFWGHLACRRFHDVHGNELGLIGVIADITERKQSESALKQSEEKYRRFYNETPVMLHSIDRNGIVVDVNDYWLKTMGYERSEVIGRKVTDFYTDASRRYAQEVIQPAFFRDGRVKNAAFQFVTKNGDVLDVLLSATAERDASGTVVRSQAVVEDITERKRSEQEARETEKKYRLLFEAANDGIFIQGATGFIDCNQQGRRDVRSREREDHRPFADGVRSGATAGWTAVGRSGRREDPGSAERSSPGLRVAAAARGRTTLRRGDNAEPARTGRCGMPAGDRSRHQREEAHGACLALLGEPLSVHYRTCIHGHPGRRQRDPADHVCQSRRSAVCSATASRNSMR